MSIKNRLVLGVVLLWVSPVLPMLAFFTPMSLSFLSDYLREIYFISGLLGVVGLALLLMPHYRESKRLQQEYRWIDKALALPILLICLSGIPPFFYGSSLYVGFSLVFLYIRTLLYMGLLLLWAWGLVFSKARFALAAVLCIAVLVYMPHPEVNNPEFYQTMKEQKSKATRPLTQEEKEVLGSQAEDVVAVKLSETDEDFSLVSIDKTPRNAVVIDERNYMRLLAAYTFMRFSRKEEEVVTEEPDGSDDELPTPEAVQD